MAARRQAEESRLQREAEAEQRRLQEEERREAIAQAELAKEKVRQRKIWIASGHPAETFEQMWPEIQMEIFMEKRRALLERTERDSVV